MSDPEAPAKIKVVFFDEATAFGGSVVVLARLFRHIDRARFVPKLVTGLDQESLARLFDPEDVLCRYRPPLGYVATLRWMSVCPARSETIQKYWARLFTAVSKIINMPGYILLLYRIARFRPDIFHANNGHDGLSVSRLLRVPLVWHLHGALRQSPRYVHRLRARASRFISISGFVSATAIAHGVDPESIDDIPNPAPVYQASGSETREEVLARFGVPRDAFVLAHVGRALPWKGQMEFLKAFARVSAAHPTAVALLAGDDLEHLDTPYASSLRTLADEAGISSRVVFAGHVTNTLELMSSVDVVVHSSIEPEPFGLVITEAMAAGTAVVAARSGGPVEIIQHGENGILVDPRDTQELAAALTLMMDDHALRKSLAKAGQETVRERYSADRYARQIESVYERILSGE